MVLHTESYTEDAVTAATAGAQQGGAAIVQGSIKPAWDGITRRGTHDTFRDMAMMEEDVVSDEVCPMCWVSVRFKKWREEFVLYKWGITQSDKTTSAGTVHETVPDHYIMHGDYDIRLSEYDSMLASQTKIAASEANSDVAAIYAFSNGPRYPAKFPWMRYRPNTIISGDVSTGATTADTLLTANRHDLTGQNANTMSAFDPDRNYIAYGVGYVTPVKDKKDMLVVAELASGRYKGARLAGFGTGDKLTHFETIYTFDGIPFKGSDQWQAYFVSGVASTPHFYIIAEQL
jgi:hypothetical protein